MLRNIAKGFRALLLCASLVSPLIMVGEDLKVTGRVQDVEGEPLIGATVMEKDKPTSATSTDVNGTYNITIPKGKKIVVTYIGYQTEEKTANATTVDFVLKESVSALDEVVVVGYATQKKISVLGSQTTMKMEHVKTPVANLSTVLAGRVAG